MKLGHKVEIAKRALASITQHDDEDREVREAALKAIEEFIAAERVAMGERIAKKIASQIG